MKREKGDLFTTTPPPVTHSAQRGARNGALWSSSKRSKRAVELWQEVLFARGSDPTGEIRLRLAAAYADNGDATKANNVLLPMRNLMLESRKDLLGEYFYRYAIIQYLEKDLDGSLTFLQAVLQMDRFDLKEIRSDPNWAGLKQSRPHEFNKIVNPQWRCKIERGAFFATVVFTNLSSFTLTNVELVSDVPGWTPKLIVDVIKPGETKRWGWTPKLAAGQQLKFTLICDQNP